MAQWATQRPQWGCYYKGTFNTSPMTTRQALILLATVLATFGGIGAYKAASEHAAYHECMAEAFPSAATCAERAGLND